MSIRSKPNNKKFEQNYDRIFNKCAHDEVYQNDQGFATCTKCGYIFDGKEEKKGEDNFYGET